MTYGGRKTSKKAAGTPIKKLSAPRIRPRKYSGNFRDGRSVIPESRSGKREEEKKIKVADDGIKYSSSLVKGPGR